MSLTQVCSTHVFWRSVFEVFSRYICSAACNLIYWHLSYPWSTPSEAPDRVCLSILLKLTPTKTHRQAHPVKHHNLQLSSPRPLLMLLESELCKVFSPRCCLRVWASLRAGTRLQNQRMVVVNIRVIMCVCQGCLSNSVPSHCAHLLS